MYELVILDVGNIVSVDENGLIRIEVMIVVGNY